MDYSRTNFKLIPLHPNTKKPRDNNWQKPDYSPNIDTNQVAIAHKYSGTCSLDIDNYEKAFELFETQGIDLGELCKNHVGIHSSKRNHYKLLFLLPEPFQTKKIVIDKETIVEFRCATDAGLTRKGGIPRSGHPETGQQYQWVGDFNNLTVLPNEIKNIWLSLLQDRDDVVRSKVDTNWDEIQSMLEVIDPDCDRQEWLSVCMALHHFDHLSDDKIGKEMFLRWSEAGKKFEGIYDIDNTWNSIKVKDGGVGVGSLFNIAYAYGFVKTEKDQSENFKTVEPEENTTKLKDPLDIINGLRPPAPDLDMELLPDVVKKYALELSKSIGADPLSSAFAMLTTISGVADARSTVEIIDGFEVPPMLWVMTVGDPSFKKTPATKPIFRILKQLEKEDRPRHNKALKIWEGEEVRYNKTKKDYLEKCGDIETMLDNDVLNTPPEDIKNAPVPLRLTVGDITSQKLIRHCAERPEGVLCYLDEMSSWVEKITNNRSGEDRASWVVGYNGDSYEMDRVGDGSTYCSNLAVALFGNIQPPVLVESIKNLSKDGIIQRFIPIVLRSKFNGVGDPVPKQLSVRPLWEQQVKAVKALDEIHYRFSNEAYKCFREFQFYMEKLKKTESLSYNYPMLTALGKVEGLTGRICLVFHLIEQPTHLEIGLDIIERVIKLVKSYIIPSYRFTYNEIAGEADRNIAVWLTNHILIKSLKHETITLREIKKSSIRFFKNLDIPSKAVINDMIRNEMMMLESYGWVTLVSERTDASLWHINSNLKDSFTSYRDNLVKMKQSQLDLIQKTSKKKRFIDGYHDALK